MRAHGKCLCIDNGGFYFLEIGKIYRYKKTYTGVFTIITEKHPTSNHFYDEFFKSHFKDLNLIREQKLKRILK